MGCPYAQLICGEYHEKKHPHYRAMKRRKAKRLKARQASFAPGQQERNRRLLGLPHPSGIATGDAGASCAKICGW
jgi:hypothetical protein